MATNSRPVQPPLSALTLAVHAPRQLKINDTDGTEGMRVDVLLKTQTALTLDFQGGVGRDAKPMMCRVTGFHGYSSGMNIIPRYDRRFCDHVSQFLANGEDIKLFTQGCCFHFALRLLYDRRFRIIDCCVDVNPNGTSRPTFFPHVWLVSGNFAVDVVGVHEREAFNERMRKQGGTICGVEPALIQTKIEEKRLNPLLSRQVNDRALWLFDNDERFEAARQLVKLSPIS